MEGAFLSAQRTASVTILAVQHLSAPGAARAGLIGAGAQASAHLGLLLSRLTGFTEVSVFDHDEDRAHELCQAHALAAKEHAVSLSVVRSAQQAVEGADLIIPLTTTTEGYIPHAWLKPGAVLVNVSLDDCLPDVAMDAGLVVVDDWGLIKDDERRLLGRLFREGRICGPEEALAGRRMVDATLGDLIVVRHPGRTGPEQIILVNPFGMAIGDVMLAKATYDSAEQLGIGLTLPFDTLEA
jgi:ornithine cyclodeaminase